ncbi:hypothetical protein ACVQ9Z_10835 [Staphylococcus aureus]
MKGLHLNYRFGGFRMSVDTYTETTKNRQITEKTSSSVFTTQLYNKILDNNEGY